MREVIPTSRPLRFGVVIGTYASAPYVHLGLECIKRHEPDVKTLVHDDDSPDKLKLQILAENYGAEFVSTEFTKRAAIGDLSAFACGLEWGARNGLDIVVKCSRRFILNRPWTSTLQDVFRGLQYATATGPEARMNWGFRSEIVAMHVSSWTESGALSMMREAVRLNADIGLPEAWHHDRAREVHAFVHPRDPLISFVDDTSDPARVDWVVRSEMHFHRPKGCEAYAWWPILGHSRWAPQPGILWHDCHAPVDYYRLAHELGLPYQPKDFEDVPIGLAVGE